jgi:hypothetical protein
MLACCRFPMLYCCCGCMCLASQPVCVPLTSPDSSTGCLCVSCAQPALAFLSAQPASVCAAEMSSSWRLLPAAWSASAASATLATRQCRQAQPAARGPLCVCVQRMHVDARCCCSRSLTDSYPFSVTALHVAGPHPLCTGVSASPGYLGAEGAHCPGPPALRRCVRQWRRLRLRRPAALHRPQCRRRLRRAVSAQQPSCCLPLLLSSSASAVCA